MQAISGSCVSVITQRLPSLFLVAFCVMSWINAARVKYPLDGHEDKLSVVVGAVHRPLGEDHFNSLGAGHSL